MAPPGEVFSGSRIGFLLIPDFTLLAFTSAVEALRLANYHSAANLYEWQCISYSGDPVQSSCGLRVTPDCALEQSEGIDALFVCAGLNVAQAFDKGLGVLLRRVAKRKVMMGGLCTGTYVLAKSGLLDGYRCTIHWENIAGLQEDFPDLEISAELFEIDRDRITCASGIAPLDMMLTLIGRQQGGALAATIAEGAMCERIRSHHDRQRIPLKNRLGTGQPRLLEAVALMEANLEEPMSPDELARHIGLSRRQLERLFQKHLGCVPTRYYLELRLQRARRLLLQTTLSIVEVALACGFVSAPHFSKCYRDFFGLPPRDQRRYT